MQNLARTTPAPATTTPPAPTTAQKNTKNRQKTASIGNCFNFFILLYS